MNDFQYKKYRRLEVFEVRKNYWLKESEKHKKTLFDLENKALKGTDIYSKTQDLLNDALDNTLTFLRAIIYWNNRMY